MEYCQHNSLLYQMQTFKYDITDIPEGEDISNLDPNHTHFILVDSKVAHWGEETEYVSVHIRYLNITIFNRINHINFNKRKKL